MFYVMKMRLTFILIWYVSNTESGMPSSQISTFYGDDISARWSRVVPKSKNNHPIIKVGHSSPVTGKQSNTFYSDMRPIMLTMRTIGIFPYIVNEAGTS